jgi:hypothetical protein
MSSTGYIRRFSTPVVGCAGALSVHPKTTAVWVISNQAALGNPLKASLRAAAALR